MTTIHKVESLAFTSSTPAPSPAFISVSFAMMQ